MKIKLLLLSLLLTFGLLCPGCSFFETTPEETAPPVSTTAPENVNSPKVSKSLPGDKTELTDTAYVYQNTDLYDQDRPASALAFSLSAGQPYAKLWVLNTSASTVSVVTYYNDTTEQIGDEITLSPGSETVLYVWANENYGDYTTVVSSGNGSAVTGAATVLVGN